MGRPRKSRPAKPSEFARDLARKAALRRIRSVLMDHMPQLETGEASVHDMRVHLGVGWDVANKLLTDDRYDPRLSTLLQLAHALDLTSVDELLSPEPLPDILRQGRT